MQRLKPYIATTLLIGVASLASYSLTQYTPAVALSLVFVPAVLVAGMLWGLMPAIFALLLTLGSSAFFFYAPIFSFAVDDPTQAIDLIIFSVIAVVVGAVADWARRSAKETREREFRMGQLYEASRRFAAVVDTDELPGAIVQELYAILGKPCALLLPRNDELVQVAVAGGMQPGPADISKARWLWQEAPLGRDKARAGLSSDWLLRVIRHGQRPAGILAVGAMRFPAPNETAFVAALFELIANVLERMRLAERVESIRVDRKADALRDAIINSISHDFRTPLASILGSATTLEKYIDLCTEQERTELLGMVRDGAQHLDRMIGRMFDLTRIRAGHLKPEREAVDLVEVVEVALRQTRQELKQHRVELRLPDEVPLARGDAVLLQQALVNILENAAKYSPAGSVVEVGAVSGPEQVRLYVRDAGRGLTPDQAERIFDQFYRAAEGNGEPDGSGLGLAIARAFIEVCGGHVTVASAGPGQGTLIEVALPRMTAAVLERDGVVA
jgi:two-component system sensor histidine kinase KdpD